MLPIRDENPTTHTSLATYAIIVANVIVWVIVQKLGTQPGLLKSIYQFGLIPAELLGRAEPGTVVPIGGGYAYEVTYSLESLTVITSMFHHGSWLHILGNMWFLGVFGDNIEDAMGPVRFLTFYLICGIAAAAAQVVSNSTSLVPMVGASGAIGGVMGAYALLYPRVRVQILVFLGFFITRVRVPAFLMLGYWFVLQLLAAMGGGQTGVAVWAHAGGFIAGVVLVLPFCSRKRLEECRRRRPARQ